jgi:ADP-ribose pyrophosphatase YjhB (NUDIX family)
MLISAEHRLHTGWGASLLVMADEDTMDDPRPMDDEENGMDEVEDDDESGKTWKDVEEVTPQVEPEAEALFSLLRLEEVSTGAKDAFSWEL